MAERKEKPSDSAGEMISNGEQQLFPIRGYVWLNVLFWAFCAVEILIIYLWLKDIRGVFFFFALLAVGFTLVSVYDCLYDRLFAATSERPDSTSDTDSTT